MLGRFCAIALMVIALPNTVAAGYLDDNPDEVFAAVYERLGALPLRAARDPFVWLRLEELKREPCDQKSIGDLALMLDKLGYRRRKRPTDFTISSQLRRGLIRAAIESVGIYLKLTDYPKAVEVADELMRRAPSDRNARYLRGVALQGAGDFQRALVDYADTVELFGSDKKAYRNVFLRMAGVLCRAQPFLRSHRRRSTCGFRSIPPVATPAKPRR